MKSIITATALAALLAATSASAFFDDQDGYTNGDFDGKGRGSAAGEGEFSMSFSGKGKGNMDADTDMTANGNAVSNSYSPYYYGAPVAPQAPVKK